MSSCQLIFHSRTLMTRAHPPSGPCQDCAADILAPLPSGLNLFVIVDYYSRYCEVVILRSSTNAKVIDRLNSIFARYGVSTHSKLTLAFSSFQRSLNSPCGKRDITLNNSPFVAPGEGGGRTSKLHFVENDPDSPN